MITISHEIFGSRFLTLRQPAWHGLGLVTQDEMDATSALNKIGGGLNYSLHPNFTEIEGELLPLSTRTIVRHPSPDDPHFVPLGQVGPEYRLLPPSEVVALWDQYVNRPVETNGVLRRGAMLFITTKLPTMDVRGDEVERYLGLTSPMDGERAATAEVWPVRTVCSNTLKAAQSRAETSFRVVHDATVKERLGVWLKHAYDEAEMKYEVVRQAFELLAGQRMTDQAAHSIIRRTYPEPRLPRRNAPGEVMDLRMERYQRTHERIVRRRQQTLELFLGDGTGMDTPAAKGTAWGLYNAVTETENYRKGFSRGGIAAEAARVGEDVLFGRRGETMQRCFDACLTVARGGEFDPSLN